MKYKLQGISCNACKQIIEMELADNNLVGCTVSAENSTIQIPDQLENKIGEISRAIENAGAYSLGEPLL